MKAVGAGLLAAAVLAGCSDPPPAAEPRPRATTAPASSVPAGPADPAPQAFTLAVAGDVHFEGVLRERLDDPATALVPAAGALAAADLAVVNLETAVGTGGAPEPGKRFTFRAPPRALDALAAAGVDVATMANNHALDFGRVALDETFAAIAGASVDVVGIGPDADAAFAPAYVEAGGSRVAVLGATTAALDPTADPTGQWAATATRAGTADAVDPARLLRAVTAADAEADVVVVYVHWGVQGRTCPSADQRDLARALVDRGADVVVGSHAHEVQGDGRLGPGYVAYGLGNWAWYTPGDRTGVFTLTVQPPAEPGGRATVTRTAWTPQRIGADGLAAPAPGTGDRGRLRACAGLNAPS